MIRKAAYGRTELFLPSKGTILREVKCMGGFGKQGRANIYHVLPAIYDDGRTVSCWHCCEQIRDTTTGIPLPRTLEHGVYYVYGITCSPGCAKAYILEHTSFDRGQQLNVLTHMLREVYGITDAVLETPPRASLRRFGGPFDPLHPPKTECKIVQPPFVSYCMLVEERSSPFNEGGGPSFLVSAAEDVDTFEEPFPPALYGEYVERQHCEQQKQSRGVAHRGSTDEEGGCNEASDESVNARAVQHRESRKVSATKRCQQSDESSATKCGAAPHKKRALHRQGPLSKFVS